MAIIASQASANGWLAVLFVSCVLAGVYVAFCVRQDLLERDLNCTDIMERSSHRLMTGCAILLVAVGMRSGIYLPIRIFKESGDRYGELVYRLQADQIAAGLAMVTLIGLLIMMWPILWRWFGRATWVALPSFAALIYGAGYFGTLALAN